MKEYVLQDDGNIVPTVNKMKIGEDIRIEIKMLNVVYETHTISYLPSSNPLAWL